MSDKEPVFKSDIEAAISDLKLYFRDYLERNRGSLEDMCKSNISQGVKDHLLEYSHFDKPTKTTIYEMITIFKGRIKTKYSITIPLSLLIIERILNKMGLF